MEASRVRGNRDNPRLRLCLGLTSVRHMVDRLEAECTQAVTGDTELQVIKYDPDVDNTYIVYNDLPFEQPTGPVLNKFVANFGVALSRCIPSVTFANFGVLSIATAVFAPRMISYLVLYPFCRLVFGTLYPAYASYKAVRTKNLKEYVKWMMYWIVFALFTCTETFTDVFLSWFPFYYEVKIVLVLWLLSPATKGSSILYRKFVHPALCRREQEIDEYIAKAKDQGYHTVLNLGTKGVNYATTVIMQTAIKGGGGLVQQLRKSYSLSDLSECEPRDERAVAADEASDVLAEPRLIRRALKSGFAARRSASESNSRQPMYFPEVDVDVRSTRSNRMDEPDFSHIKSSEDISSGYSSADNSASLTRTGSVGAAGVAGRARARTSRTTTVTTIKRPQAAEDNEVLIEEVQDDDPHNYTNMPSLVNVSSCLYLSHTNPPFIYQYVGDQVKIIQVLGQYPLSDETNVKCDIYNKIEQNTIPSEDKPEINLDKSDTSQVVIEKDEKVENIITLENSIVEETKPNFFPEVPGDSIANNDEKDIVSIKKDANNEIECSINEPNYLLINTSAESLTDNYTTDDEASFGTPADSPKLHKKNQKGKYGKNKAPLPPINDTIRLVENEENVDNDETSNGFKTESKEIKKDEEPANNADVLSSWGEKKDQKSKSPLRIVKSSGIGFGKILQLPSKLAFWHKVDNKHIPDSSSCFDEKNGSASTENINGYFQNKDAVSSTAKATKDIIDIPLRKRSDDEMSFEDALETENEVTSQDIIEKSDVLQKLIVAKIESYPEYKYRPFESEISTSSKTTDL